MNDTLYGYIISLPLVDSWERLPHCCSLRPRRDIVAELLSDAPAGAMTAAGLDVETLALARSDELSVREKWALIEPYWSLCAHTSACRAAKLAARELYGLDAINACTIEAYDAAFQSTFDADRYKYILKERCHIEFAVLFGDNGNDNLTHAFDTADSGTSESSSGRHTCPHAAGTEPDPRYFRPAGDIGRLVSPASGEAALAVGHEVGVNASAFDDYLEACCRSLKSIAERSRVICCDPAPLPLPASYSDARSAYAGMMSASRGSSRDAVSRYVFRHLLGLAEELGMTMRLDDGSADSVYYAGLFTQFPNLKFDVLVSISPGCRELSRYAGVLPNVYANLSRVPGEAAEYLRFVPYNKLICFGGGCTTIDAVYGRALMTRETVSKVLSRMLAAGELRHTEAEAVARALLYENAHRLYSG
jgi:hypothetical protein